MSLFPSRATPSPPPVSASVALASQAGEADLVRRRLVDIQDALTANEMRLRTHGPNTFAAQEATTERHELESAKRGLQSKLNALTAPAVPSPAMSAQGAKQAAIFHSILAERRSHITAFVNRLEASGDHRQARLWRNQLLELPALVARELGLQSIPPDPD